MNVARICGGIIWMAGPAPLLDICPLGVFLRPFGKLDMIFTISARCAGYVLANSYYYQGRVGPVRMVYLCRYFADAETRCSLWLLLLLEVSCVGCCVVVLRVEL